MLRFSHYGRKIHPRPAYNNTRLLKQASLYSEHNVLRSKYKPFIPVNDFLSHFTPLLPLGETGEKEEVIQEELNNLFREN